MTPNVYTQPPMTAGGNVAPKRFITPSTTAGKTAVQASAASQLLIGVSEMWTRYPPGSPSDDGYVAVSTEPLPYRGPLQIASLTLGGTVSNPATPLTTDANGKGVAASTGNYVGALALELGVSGEDIDVYVLPPFLAP